MSDIHDSQAKFKSRLSFWGHGALTGLDTGTQPYLETQGLKRGDGP